MLLSIWKVRRKDKITISEIRNQTKSEDISNNIRKLKFNYVGHVAYPEEFGHNCKIITFQNKCLKFSRHEKLL